MRRFLNNKFLLVLLFIILFGLLACLYLVSYPGLVNNFQLETKVLEIVENFNLREKSSVEVFASEDSSSSGELKFKFDIKDSDKPVITKLSQNLGTSDYWTKGMSLTLNQESLDKIKPVLPLKLSLNITPREVRFSNGQILKLNSGVTSQEYNFASQGGSLKLKGSDVNDFDLNIMEPAIVVSESSNSGKLYYSSALSGLYPLLARVYTIDLRVSGKTVEGSIKLK